MAFPVVASETSSKQDTNTTTHTVAMPSGITVGDRLFLVFETDGRPAVSGQIPDNWVQIPNSSSGSSGDQVGVKAYEKFADGTEGTSQTITTDVSQCSSHYCARITGSSSTAAECAVTQGSSTTAPDSPSLNPAGWDVEDTLWFSISCSDDGSIAITGFPSGYTGTGQQPADSSADGVTLAWARKNSAAASEDPGAFTLASASFWVGMTFAFRPVSPVANVAVGAKSAGGTTTISVAYPASIAAGQMILAARSGWRSDITMADESGWTNTSELGGGTGTSVDAHTTKIRVDRKEASGSESGSVTFDQSGSTNPGCLGIMLSYVKSPSSATWGVAQTTGDDATHGSNRSATGSAALDFQPGDVLVALVAADSDSNLASFSSPSLTASGITFSTAQRRSPASAGVTTGDDGNIEAIEATVTAGTGSATPTLSYTTATATCGPVSFIRLRAVTSSPPVSAITEADALVGATRTSDKAAALIVETDALITASRTHLVGVLALAELDVLQGVAHTSAPTISTLIEIDALSAVTRSSMQTVAVLTESDALTAAPAVHALTVTLLAEIETLLVPTQSSNRSAGLLIEQGMLLGSARSSSYQLGTWSELDALTAGARTGNHTVASLAELDALEVLIAADQVDALAESDQLLAVGHETTRPVVLLSEVGGLVVVERSTAQAVGLLAEFEQLLGAGAASERSAALLSELDALLAPIVVVVDVQVMVGELRRRFVVLDPARKKRPVGVLGHRARPGELKAHEIEGELARRYDLGELEAEL